MTNVRELRQAFDKAVQNARQRALIPGRLGTQDSSGNWVFDVPGWPGYVYVRIGRDEETTTLHKAVNNAVGLIPDLPVWIEKNADGVLAIVGVRTTEYIAMSGGTRTGATVAPHTHEPGGGMVDPVSERRIKPGLVRAYQSGGAYGLSVYIEPFTFRYNGIEKRWPGGTLNLTSYLPATENMHRWVKIGVDPNAVSAVAVAGSEKSKLVALLDSELDAISFQSYVPLAGVKLVYGQTTISSETSFLGCRPWWSGVGSGALATATIDLWDVDQPPAQAEDENDEFSDGALAGKWTEFDSGSIQTPTESGETLALAQTSQATATLTGVYQTLPAGDFTIAVKLSLDADTPSGDGQAWQTGIALWENAASDTAAAFLAGPAVEQVAGSVRRAIGWSTWAGHDDLTLPYWDSQGFAWEVSTALYLRLRRTGTEYHLDWGADGEAWYTSTVLVDFTPAQVGIGLYNKASGVTITGSFEFFRRRATYDALTAPVYGGIDLSAGKLGELGDVDFSTPPTDGQGILYEASTATWKPGDAAGVFNTLDEKDPPVSGDLLLIEDSNDSWAKKKVRVGNLPGGSGGGNADIGARVYNDANISINAATDTILTFNSERWDTDTIHDPITNPSRLTCQTAGLYLITAHVRWTAQSGGARRIAIVLNGTTKIAQLNMPTTGTADLQSVTTVYKLNVNDYVEVEARQTSSSTVNIEYSANHSPEFAMQLLAET